MREIGDTYVRVQYPYRDTILLKKRQGTCTQMKNINLFI